MPAASCHRGRSIRSRAAKEEYASFLASNVIVRARPANSALLVHDRSRLWRLLFDERVTADGAFYGNAQSGTSFISLPDAATRVVDPDSRPAAVSMDGTHIALRANESIIVRRTSDDALVGVMQAPAGTIKNHPVWIARDGSVLAFVSHDGPGEFTGGVYAACANGSRTELVATFGKAMPPSAAVPIWLHAIPYGKDGLVVGSTAELKVIRAGYQPYSLGPSQMVLPTSDGGVVYGNAKGIFRLDPPASVP